MAIKVLKKMNLSRIYQLPTEKAATQKATSRKSTVMPHRRLKIWGRREIGGGGGGAQARELCAVANADEFRTCFAANVRTAKTGDWIRSTGSFVIPNGFPQDGETMSAGDKLVRQPSGQGWLIL